MKKTILIFFLVIIGSASFAQLNAKMPVIIAPKFKKDTTNIKKFGAMPDGHFLHTKAINNAIDACNKKGGGVRIWS